MNRGAFLLAVCGAFFLPSATSGADALTPSVVGTHRSEGYDLRSVTIPPEAVKVVDPAIWAFYGRVGLFRRWAMLEDAEGRRFPRAVDVPVAQLADQARGYFPSVAGDLPGEPLVMLWPPYSKDKLYPHGFGGSWYDGYPGLDTYAEVYWLTGDRRYLDRLQQFADFVVRAQYDNTGRSGFLDLLGVEYKKHPEYAGGWPTHDFAWTDGFGYLEPSCEPSHHIDAHTAFSLIKAFEATGENKYLRAARRFVEKQMPFFGMYEGEWCGGRTIWTGYNPAPTWGSPDDAVTNVDACCALAVAAVGHHTKNQHWLFVARSLLWHTCRELVERHYWYYFAKECSLKDYRSKKAGEEAVLVFGATAIPYLEASGIDVAPIRDVFARAALFYLPHFRDTGFAHAARIVLPASDDTLEIVTTVRVLDFRLKDLHLLDDIPAQAPAQLQVAIRHGDRTQVRTVSRDDLCTGIVLASSPRIGDVFELRYHLSHVSPEEIAAPRLKLSARVFEPRLGSEREIVLWIRGERPPKGRICDASGSIQPEFRPWFLPRKPSEKERTD